VNNLGLDQGYLLTALPKVNCIYNIWKNKTVAITEIIDPKLLIKFHPAKASG
jgi:hypothetical protein